MSSRAVALGGDEVVEHGAVDDVGQASSPAAHGFVRAFPDGDLAVVIGRALGGVVLAVPCPAVAQVLAAHAEHLAGKDEL